MTIAFIVIVMKIVSWDSTRVNKVILEETSISVGENGYVEDTDAAGFHDRRLTAFSIPDKYNVTMDFDWGGAGSEFQKPATDGISEYDWFVRWYKYTHQRGANPFWFPCIAEKPVNNLGHKGMCLYRITSALNASKSGYSMRVTMTWEEVYSGTVEVSTVTPEFDSIIAYNGKISAIFSNIPSSDPIFSNFNLKMKLRSDSSWSTIPLIEMSGDENKYNLTYSKITVPGEYDVVLEYNGVEKTGTLEV